MTIPAPWTLTRAFLESFIDALVGIGVATEIVDGEEVLKRKVIPPELKDRVKADFFAVFDEEWLKQNRAVSPDEENVHPLVQITRYGMEHYLECIVGTFSWICQADASWLIIKRPRTIVGLRDTALFHATLFELDILNYLLKSGAKVAADHKTSGAKDVEALVELKNALFYVECKILEEGGETERIKNELRALCDPFASHVRMSGLFRKFPSWDDVEAIKKAHAEAEANSKSNKLSLSSGVVTLTYGARGGLGQIEMPEPDDERIKATMDKALTKVRHMKLPTVLFVKVDMGAGIGNACRKLADLLQDKKYRKFSKVYVVNKVKSALQGFDLEVYEVPNLISEYPCKLRWSEAKKLFDVDP